MKTWILALSLWVIPGVVDAQVDLRTYYRCENPQKTIFYIKFVEKGEGDRPVRFSVSYGQNGRFQNSFLIERAQIQSNNDRLVVEGIGPDSVFRSINGIYLWQNFAELSVSANGQIFFRAKKVKTLRDPYGRVPDSAQVEFDDQLTCQSSDQPMFNLVHRFFDCGPDFWMRLTQEDRGFLFSMIHGVAFRAEWYQVAGYPIFKDHVGYMDAQGDDRRFFFFKTSDLSSGAKTLEAAVFDKGTNDISLPHQKRICHLRIL